MKFKVAIARFPNYGWECQECTDFLVRTTRAMDKDPRIEKVIPLRATGTPIPMMRNKAVLDARKQGAAFLLMVDADMAPELYHPDAPLFWDTAWEFMMARETKRQERRDDIKSRTYRLCDEDEAVVLREIPPATVSAPYCGPPPSELCYVFHWLNQESENPNPDWKLELVPRAMAAIMQGTQEVAAMATGLILYDMRVFDILPPPWFKYEYRDATESEKVTTEDVYQTRNASLLGLPQMVAWDCWAGHSKDKMVGKPRIVTRDQVHESLKQAVLRGVDSNQRLVVLTEQVPEDAKSLGDVLASSPQMMEALMAADWNPGDYFPDPHKKPETQG